jgi:riboflavin synthase
MFTGITRGTFVVTAVDRGANSTSYLVDLTGATVALEPGASVSIDGVCQTVVHIDGSIARFDAIKETLDKTTLDTLEVGRTVSIERAARMGDEIGGHQVSGHITGTGTITSTTHDAGEVTLRIAVPPDWMRFLLHKGFVAVDGSSLTIGDRDDSGWFDVHLIPETCRLTNLCGLSVGDHVNIELDPQTVAIVTTVERVLAQRGLDR